MWHTIHKSRVEYLCPWLVQYFYAISKTPSWSWWWLVEFYQYTIHHVPEFCSLEHRFIHKLRISGEGQMQSILQQRVDKLQPQNLPNIIWVCILEWIFTVHCFGWNSVCIQMTEFRGIFKITSFPDLIKPLKILSE